MGGSCYQSLRMILEPRLQTSVRTAKHKLKKAQMENKFISGNTPVAPVVSIIIPTYNGSRYLALTIESVLNQTFGDFEIIVVDDGSEENIEEVLKPFANRISFIRIQNSGPAAARNVGIRASRGEFIALLDHDDIWGPENLETKLDFLNKNPDYAMAYSYPELIDSEGNALQQIYPSEFPSGPVFEDFLYRNRITSFSCTLIRKSIFLGSNLSVGLLDERKDILCCDDYDMWLRIADVNVIGFSPDKQVYYRIHNANLTSNLDKALDAHMTVFRRALKERTVISLIPGRRLAQIVKEHIYMKFQTYAVNYYYLMRYKKARKLFGICICKKPFVLTNWRYFLICLLPASLIDRLRLAKKHISALVNSRSSRL
jgi:glycosyltransferase involved in cell wall biosynthesis